MFSVVRLLVIAALSVSFAEAIVSPAYQGAPYAEDGSLESTASTDVDAIFSTISSVDQNGGDSNKTSGRVEANVEQPEGYEYVFGPLKGANSAPHYMGFVLLEKYDPSACAQECNKRSINRVGGACKYFNIWMAFNIVTNHTQSYTCAMYYIPANASTATNTGQGDIMVQQSRGYKRTTLVPDGDFENYRCSDGGAFCFTEKTPTWNGTSPANGNFDATIFHYGDYAYHGTGVGLLGSAYGLDSLPGTLSPVNSLRTKAGRTYSIQFFLSSTFSGPQRERDAYVSVVWNGRVVKTFYTGYAPWHYYEVIVVAGGGDQLSFVGGKAPAWTFIDEVYVFLI
ncbi:hypothetical protein L218DRAFT_1073794 [Marasmius fiardii PR-910]|nr:hypothetical protein L218DRAFT_1073794 [Marasmius fiardii PR-910]